MKKWLKNNQLWYGNIKNSEQMAKSRIGKELYEKLVKHYTYKQWAKYPEELDKSVLSRIPVRHNHDTRYFSNKYQALPKHGYTSLFESILDNDNIEYRLETDYLKFKKDYDLSNTKIIFTGPVDLYFADAGLPKLEYRSIDFHWERYKNMNYYQPNSVVNYPGNEVEFTRIVEYKHFLNQQSKHTIIAKETTTDDGDPYYPVPNQENLNLFEKYKKMSAAEKNVTFVGRLANYKYFDMDASIKNALDISKKLV